MDIKFLGVTGLPNLDESARFNVVATGPREQIYRTTAFLAERDASISLEEHCQFDIEDVDSEKIRGRVAFIQKGTTGRIGTWSVDPSKTRENTRTKMKLKIKFNDEFESFADVCNTQVFVECELRSVLDKKVAPVGAIEYRDYSINVTHAIFKMKERNQK